MPKTKHFFPLCFVSPLWNAVVRLHTAREHLLLFHQFPNLFGRWNSLYNLTIDLDLTVGLPCLICKIETLEKSSCELMVFVSLASSFSLVFKIGIDPLLPNSLSPPTMPGKPLFSNWWLIKIWRLEIWSKYFSFSHFWFVQVLPQCRVSW